MFSPSLLGFFTNDDFFHFVTARAYNLKDFLNFFNLYYPATGFPNYRPLATQVFYFLDWKFFDLNPLPMHILLFILFFGIIILVYKIAKELTKNEKTAILTTALYAVSATHFGQLYFLATQEIIYGFFFFLTVWLFIKYLDRRKTKFIVYSFLSFLLTLASKEPAITLPFVLGLIYLFLIWRDKKKIELKKITTLLSPFFLVLAGYLFMRFFHYGFAKGDSYLWAFVPKRIINSLGWYSLWALNMPEMLVDFVGPGLKFNPNLFRYWPSQIIPIFILFVIQVVLGGYLFLRNLLLSHKTKLNIVILGIIWFVGTLVPVLFLPIHKFTFYLTVPLFGVVMTLGYLLSNLPKWLVYFFLILFFTTSLVSLSLTSRVSWITRGQETAKRIFVHFLMNKEAYSQKTIVFVDTEKDIALPWSPTETVSVILSKTDFFELFFPGKFKIIYDKEGFDSGNIHLQTRQFLGY
jgi:hypothetical protein